MSARSRLTSESILNWAFLFPCGALDCFCLDGERGDGDMRGLCRGCLRACRTRRRLVGSAATGVCILQNPRRYRFVQLMQRGILGLSSVLRAGKISRLPDQISPDRICCPAIRWFLVIQDRQEMSGLPISCRSPVCRRNLPVDKATWQCCRVHFMRNALAYAGKTQRRMVSAAIGTVFVQNNC